MWNLVRTVPNVIAAQMWRDLLEAEGLPCRIERLRAEEHLGGRANYRVLCARGKEHIADDIMINAFLLADTSGQAAEKRAFQGLGRAPKGPSLPEEGSPSLPGSPGDPFGTGQRADVTSPQEPLP